MPRLVTTAGFATAISAFAGLGVVALNQSGRLVLFAAVLIGAAAIVGLYLGGESVVRNPIASFLVALSILAVAWQGVQGPGSVPVSDLPFLIAVPLIGLALIQRQMPLVLPGWLMVVVGGLVLGALLAALFVRHPPDYVIGHVSAAQLGAAASRQNDLALLLRTIYALAFVPVLIAAVASSWERIRFFADVWVVSTVICALAAILDHFAHAGIGNALVTGPLPTDRAVGLTDQPNYLGQFTAMALPVAIVRTYQLKGSGRVAYLGATGVLIIALQLSGSRLGLLGALVAVGFLAALVPRVRKGILLGGIVLSVLGAGLLVYQPAGHSVLERFSGDPAATNADNVRRYVLERTWDIARDHLPTGVGFSRILDSHSLVIQFLLAGGVVALAAFCIWVWGMCRLGVTVALSDRAPPEGAQLAAALTAALLAWLVPGIVNPQLLERFMYVPAGLLLAMGYCLARSPAWSAAIEGAKSSWASAVSAGPARREPILAATPREGHP